MSYEIKHCKVSDILTLADDLLKEHWDEICVNKKMMKIKPDESAYEALEDSGKLIILGAFLDDALVGYSVNIISNHPHYVDLKCLSNDLLFVSKDHRGSTLGMRLIKFTEQEAEHVDARMMMWHCKKGTALEAIMQRQNYNVQDVIYSKEV
tara:strand:+ start:192 stop:644 length:453 start_codon:yes stop_codon:yes gene_type:complete